jgi:uncharacterized membrane protein
MPGHLSYPAPGAPDSEVIVLRVDAGQALTWLARGWNDLRQLGLVSYVHGLVMVMFAALMLLLGGNQFWFLAGAFSGFLVVAPILATSLYALSRALQGGCTPDFLIISRTWANWHSGRFNRWGKGHWALARFGLLLGLAGTGWVLTSASMVKLLVSVPVNTPMDFLKHVVLSRENYVFEAWMVLGAVMAAPIFASTVVTVPLLLDKKVGLWQAVLTSWSVVLANPAAMAVWAALIMLLTLLGFATGLLGLVVVVPMLGHASWHAYRDVLDASSWPDREGC